ncbi:tyrosine-type recombinase/integrase [Elioraea tepidiphila]|uniref:tyrosine-type recombinase/integrase n=1 Tax=Elioraea tepidiphila TaxID=457934 RepID=UPI00035D0466|nr:integrase arm-type DNA-binding domain-containing protein [Elioraea tepidiphila]
MQRDLTDAFLRSLRPPASGRIEAWDTRVRGLHLRMTATGAASWAVRANGADGRRHRVTLGPYPALPLAKARQKALETLAALAQGQNPVAERRQARERRRAEAVAPTVAARWQEWADIASRTALRGRGWSDAHRERVDRTLRLIVGPALGKRALRDITRADWTGLIATAHRERGPAAAGNTARVIGAFLSFAETSGWIDASPLPRRAATRLAPPVAARARSLSDDELRRVWRAADALGPKPRAFVRLLIVTACRRSEVAGLRLGEVDREAGLWTIPAARAKNRAAHAVPLGPLALAALAEVWPQDAAELAPDHALLGHVRGSALSGFSKIKARLDRASGVTDWTWHDLRRTARTGMSRLGVSREAAEAALAHISGRGGLVGVYDRHDYAREAAEALRTWQAFVAGLVGQGAEVVALAERRAKA